MKFKDYINETKLQMTYTDNDIQKIKKLLDHYGFEEGKFKDYYETRDGKINISFKSPLQRDQFIKDLKKDN